MSASIFRNTFARSKSGSEVGERDGMPQDWRPSPEVFAKMTKGKTTAEEIEEDQCSQLPSSPRGLVISAHLRLRVILCFGVEYISM